MRVLIVEDETRLAENIALSLRESAGYAVDIAPDGQEGLFLAESNVYDLLLLDLMLPGMDGMELLKRIRKLGQHTPVLVVTARDDRKQELWGDGYLLVDDLIIYQMKDFALTLTADHL